MKKSTIITGRRQFLTGSAALGVAAGLGAVPLFRARAAEPIKLGLLTVLSGNFSPIGEDMRRGAQLLLKQMPDINGRPIKLVVEDSEGKPAVALRKASKLASDDGVDAIFGVFSSGEMVALAGAAEKMGVPIITTNAATARLTGELCNKLVFRTSPNDDQMLRATTAWLKSDEKARKGKWYMLGHDYEWGRGAVASFKKFAGDQLGVEVVGESYAPLDTRDWSTYIDKIKASKADYIWAPIIVSVVTDFVTQARSFGLLDQARVVAVAGITDSQLAAVGEAAKGVYTASWATWTVDTPAMKQFNDAYWKEFKVVPGFQAIVTYAGGALMLDGFKKAKSTKPADLVPALEQASFDGPYGKLTMRKEDHQATLPAFIGEVRQAQSNEFGAKWAVYPIHTASPADTTVPMADTGCKGL